MKRLILFTSVIMLVSSASALSLAPFNFDPKAGVIQLDGPITSSSEGFSSGITPDQVRELNRRAMDNDVDAIIYEINSGGGAVVASKEVMREVESVPVPTVCRFRDIGASGAYMIALGCDRIVADSATLTGSIGVRSSYIEFSGTLDRFGAEYINISSGRYKELGSPYMNISEEEKQILKNKTVKIHEEFLAEVQSSRNLTDDQMQDIQTGEVFLGERAKNLGLVDSIGGRRTAYEEAENLTGRSLRFVRIENPQPFNLGQLFGIPSFSNSLTNLPVITPFRAEYP